MKYKLLIISALAYILAVACKKETREIEPPYNLRCNYVLKGTIFNSDLVVLENIEVKLYEITPDSPSKSSLRDKAISDENGFYEVKNMNTIPYIYNTYRLHFSDLNHNYKDTVVTVIFTNENFTGGNGDKFLGDAVWEFNVFLSI